MIVSRYWWETSPVVEYVGSWKKRFANVESRFWRMNFMSSKLLVLYIFNRLIPAFIRLTFSFFGRSYNDFHICEVIFFWDLAQVWPLIFFWVICRQPVGSSRHFILLQWFSQTRCLAMSITVNNFSQAVCHHKKRTCSVWVVFTDKHFHTYN